MSIRSPTIGAAAAATTTSAAPWRELFLQHLSQMPMPLCAVSTVGKVQQGVSKVVVPHVRTCMFRGLWGTLPANPHNPAPHNPTGVVESDIPVFTTDGRMAKAWELVEGHEPAYGPDGEEAAVPTSLRGGAVELVWWVAGAGAQWRICGQAWVLGSDVETDAGAAARQAIGARMRWAGSETDWSWAREVTSHFGNLSPAMRGSFRNPAPGRPRLAGSDKTGLGRPVEDGALDDVVARANFRVVVVVPEAVDYVDLARADDARRWVYTYVGEDNAKSASESRDVVNGWEVVEVWP